MRCLRWFCFSFPWVRHFVGFGDSRSPILAYGKIGRDGWESWKERNPRKMHIQVSANRMAPLRPLPRRHTEIVATSGCSYRCDEPSIALSPGLRHAIVTDNEGVRVVA